jgi:hypothetical protein
MTIHDTTSEQEFQEASKIMELKRAKVNGIYTLDLGTYHFEHGELVRQIRTNGFDISEIEIGHHTSKYGGHTFYLQDNNSLVCAIFPDGSCKIIPIQTNSLQYLSPCPNTIDFRDGF